ncbi:MAG: antitoxin PrlF [Thermotogaceae bacterium]|jgi:AbrB family looped-hinge helix DNA binding protein|nr:antitoxin PrlF [Thermotogaceae bacterium]
MELAKITSKGQVTIPVGIRKELGLKKGDKIVFLHYKGNIIIANSALIALKKAQKAFSTEAKKTGLENEQDVIDMVNEVREELAKKYLKED